MTRIHDERISEAATIKEVRKQQVLQTVLNAGTLKLAAKTLDTNQDELRIRLLHYGVKHEPYQVWHEAVRQYIDAGQPYQYEMNLLSASDWLAKDTEFEERLEEEIATPSLKEELYSLAMTRRSIQNYSIECELEQRIKSKYEPMP